MICFNNKRLPTGYARDYFVCLGLVLGIICGLFMHVNAQSSQPKKIKIEKEIRNLIKKSLENDLKTRDNAGEELLKLELDSIPILFKIVKKAKPCEQVQAASVVLVIDKGNKEIIPLLVGLFRGGNLLSLFNLREEFMCRRRAAFLLAESADGIKELNKVLKKGDLWERQSVIFAFDDLTETSEYPPDVYEAVKEAIPIIAESLKSKDKVLSEMSYEVLSQISGHSPTELKELAQKYIDESEK
jgi:hypothetical protein